MNTYLIGIMFHEPDAWNLWHKGVVEDYESSSGLFVGANSAEQAIAWGEVVGEALLRYVNHDATLQWHQLGYRCWVEGNPSASCWKHCLSHFQTVKVGTMPDFEKMTSKAYAQ